MKTDPPPQSPELLRRLLRARDRIDAASHEAWPVARLASVCGFSEAHFSREFRRAFGLPPHRYLLSRRIERAKRLLRETALPVTEIAFQTGWSSLGTFGRVFREVTGERPGDLRERERIAAIVNDFGAMPACLLAAAQRPDLLDAVLSKPPNDQARAVLSKLPNEEARAVLSKLPNEEARAVLEKRPCGGAERISPVINNEERSK